MNSTISYTKDFVISKDGTKIGYRQLGNGPGLILVHGGMMAAQNLMQLGALLADQFTVYIPDRQGRGQSQRHNNFGLVAEGEDIQALVNKTKAENVYGLSAGAVVTLQTSIIEKGIKKICLHEPPILVDETRTDWITKYKESMNKKNYGKAFMSIVNGTDDPSSLFNILPTFLIAPLMNIAIKSEAKKKKENSDDVPLKPLIDAMFYDIKIIEDSAGIINKYKNTTADVLLIKGTKSQPYLRNTIDKLSAALPKAKFVELVGQGHTVSNNGEKPELVAAELKRFFMNNIH
ncbi:alpha/beta fold hydrolase [Pinibacter aurantiacus]|uniref:Alpha/beta hydrolase n=1 Tax=Pinibacter aurantiacus TaxID=2851599 RepID=A0A9E2SBR6_9BACT|nr:alpha/beta hydrolase [Pinibacter aurantiacus]MBV4359217.1 alpha/beta hydrolase [Pinibacter aurantiacus]